MAPDGGAGLCVGTKYCNGCCGSPGKGVEADTDRSGTAGLSGY